MRTYETTVFFVTSKQVTVQAKDRREATERAAKLARRRYNLGPNDITTLSVPFLAGDKE